MNTRTKPASSDAKQAALQRRLDALSIAHIVLAENGAVLCANAAARALLEATGLVDIRTRMHDWFDATNLAEIAANGLCHFDREYLNRDRRMIALQVRMHAFTAEAVPTARYLVIIEVPLPDAAAIGELAERQRELERVLTRLHDAQDQLLQSDKMASIGQLAAGVAHEINNPIGYIHSNLGTLVEYLDNLFRLNLAYERALREVRTEHPERWAEIEELKEQIDYEFLMTDLPKLLQESREGIDRVRKIVADLRDFSRAGYSEKWVMADLHKGLESTLNIVWNDLKYKCDVSKQYSDLPLIECLPSQLNQVFLNILVNAGHAITDRGTITIATGLEGDRVFVDISDSGKGIAQENLGRIFDPFFTTKPVGQGTGLGLSLSYGIVRKHGGRIEVYSQLGAGTRFRVLLPLRQPHRDAGDPGQTDPSVARHADDFPA
jgi:two-component system, NtrC family, sensor kinase